MCFILVYIVILPFWPAKLNFDKYAPPMVRKREREREREKNVVLLEFFDSGIDSSEFYGLNTVYIRLYKKHFFD